MEEKEGCTKTPMYEDTYSYATNDIEWPPKDQSEAARNHRNRVERNRRNENTR